MYKAFLELYKGLSLDFQHLNVKLHIIGGWAWIPTFQSEDFQHLKRQTTHYRGLSLKTSNAEHVELYIKNVSPKAIWMWRHAGGWRGQKNIWKVEQAEVLYQDLMRHRTSCKEKQQYFNKTKHNEFIRNFTTAQRETSWIRQSTVADSTGSCLRF